MSADVRTQEYDLLSVGRFAFYFEAASNRVTVMQRWPNGIPKAVWELSMTRLIEGLQ